jgi:hypothetical protein
VPPSANPLHPAARPFPTAELVRVGMATDDPEQDSLGLATAPLTPCLVPRFSEWPQPVGALIGDPEKDSFGFVVLGTEPCPPASRPR